MAVMMGKEIAWELVAVAVAKLQRPSTSGTFVPHHHLTLADHTCQTIHFRELLIGIAISLSFTCNMPQVPWSSELKVAKPKFTSQQRWYRKKNSSVPSALSILKPNFNQHLKWRARATYAGDTVPVGSRRWAVRLQTIPCNGGTAISSVLGLHS
jgi:hypothetical protein